MSILIHAGLGVLALFIVFSTGVMDKQVDFLPGGGTAQGAQASQDLQHKAAAEEAQLDQQDDADEEAGEHEHELVDHTAGGAAGRAGHAGRERDARRRVVRSERRLWGGRSRRWFWQRDGDGGGQLCDAAAVDEKPLLDTGAFGEAEENGGTPECEAAVSASLESAEGQAERRRLGLRQQGGDDRSGAAVLPGPLRDAGATVLRRQCDEGHHVPH